MTSVPTSANQPPGNPVQWSPEARTWVSLLLFVHLFAVFVAVAAYTRSSGFERRLLRLFEPYLNNLYLSPTHSTYPFARYYLTHAAQSDVDFSCEVDVEGTDSETLVVPDSGLWPGVRFRRYQALANVAGYLSQAEGDDNLAGILPKTIAAGVLGQRGEKQGVVRVRAHFLAPIDAPAKADRGPLTTQYEAEVFSSGDHFDLHKRSAKFEVAPLERRAKGARGASGPAPPKASKE